MLGGLEVPTIAAFKELKYNMRCINESMRLYPHPPVLLRRALVAHELPGGIKVRRPGPEQRGREREGKKSGCLFIFGILYIEFFLVVAIYFFQQSSR